MKKRYKTKIAVEVLGNLQLGVILLTTILAYTPALAQLPDYNPQGLKATTLEEVVALPDEEVDLATAIMIVYKEWDPSFDAMESLEEIERMAVELEGRISPDDNPEKVVSLINRYLFEENAYSVAVPWRDFSPDKNHRNPSHIRANLATAIRPKHAKGTNSNMFPCRTIAR